MADIVRGQMAYPDPKGPMPANLYSGQDATDIALYVAQCSAVPHCGVTAEKPPGSSTTTTTGGGGGGTTTTAAGPNAAGKHIFETAGCASCHTLKDAGATGTVGPNLDGLKPSESQVANQVTVGGGAMPSFKGTLTPAQITAVAKYVSSVAGK
jgi:cytochrome c553